MKASPPALLARQTDLVYATNGSRNCFVGALRMRSAGAAKPLDATTGRVRRATANALAPYVPHAGPKTALGAGGSKDRHSTATFRELFS